MLDAHESMNHSAQQERNKNDRYSRFAIGCNPVYDLMMMMFQSVAMIVKLNQIYQSIII